MVMGAEREKRRSPNLAWLVVATAGNHCGDPPFRQHQLPPSHFTVPTSLCFHSVPFPAAKHVEPHHQVCSVTAELSSSREAIPGNG